ncbi:MAG: ABC transporter ATP-binding protein/permease [Ignavibacteria bacterium]|nr:ABC transporter ATP-binding protein/permease [Ignavibacteria bacterium]
MHYYKRLFRYLKPYIKPLIMANLFMLLVVVFSLLSVLMVFPFIDLLFKENSSTATSQNITSVFDIKVILVPLTAFLQGHSKMQALLFICIAIILTFVLKNFFSVMQTYYMTIVEQGVLKDIRAELYRQYLRLPLSFFTEERKGNLISRLINDVQIMRDSSIAVINSLFRDPPMIISYSVILFLFNWKLTLIIFLLAPVTALLLSKVGNSLKRSSQRSQEKISNITSILDESIGAIRIVKAFNMESYEMKRFDYENERYKKDIIKLDRKRSLGSPISETIGVITFAIILYIVGYQLINGTSDMTAGSFIAYLALFFNMMPSLKLIGQVSNVVKEGSAASERVFSLIDIKPDIVDLPDAVSKKDFSDSIEFKNVSFKYEKSSEILKNVNLKISRGEVVALVGPSGAGKSTLVDLIPRFYDAQSGEILIDGTNIKNVKSGDLRKLMGIVTQETLLFNDSIRNNIAYGESEIPLEKIIEAAKAANAHNFISRLEKGYDTVIGDRGVKLSGGERQRLSIARALLKNPPILILDEATSSLDTESEILVQQAIERLMEGRTSIVIAHRLSTIQNADKIVVISKGEIVETGKHSVLLENDGVYKKLHGIQFKYQEYKG